MIYLAVQNFTFNYDDMNIDLGARPLKSRSPKSKKATLSIAFFTIFLDLLGFGIVIPVNSFYVESLGASAAIITLLSAAYSLMQFLFSPFWGRLSDRVGRRPIILTSVLFSAVGHLLFGLSDTLLLVFVARLLAGFGNANLAAAQAIISDTMEPSERAKGMGLIGAAFGLGFLLGPAIGGYAGQFSPQAPALVAAALAGVNFLSAWFFLPETLNKSESSQVPDGHGPRREIFSFATFRKAIQSPNVATILKISFLNTAAFAMFEVVVGLLMAQAYLGVDDKGTPGHIAAASRLTAWFLVVVGVTAVLVQGGLIGRLSRKFGDEKLIRTGLAIIALSIVAMPLFAFNLPYSSMLVLACFLACGTGIANPSQSALLSKCASSDDQGGIFGLNQSMSALGRVVGPLMAGWLFEINAGLTFYVAGGIGFVAWLISRRLAFVRI